MVASPARTLAQSAGKGQEDQGGGRVAAGVRLGKLAGQRIHLLAEFHVARNGLAPLFIR